MDDQIAPWFQAAAASLLEDMPAEKALALALAKITGNTQLKVRMICSIGSKLEQLHGTGFSQILALALAKIMVIYMLYTCQLGTCHWVRSALVCVLVTHAPPT